MKKSTIMLGAFMMLCLSSCTKKSSSSSTTTTPTPTTYPNTFTISDNGSSYSVNGNNGNIPFVTAVVMKTPSNATLQLNNDGSGQSFHLSVYFATGPLSGLGTYTMFRSTPGNVLVESVSGGQSYTIDTGYANITSCSSTKLSGTLTLMLSNSVGSKTVTGNINCNQPTVQ